MPYISPATGAPQPSRPVVLRRKTREAFQAHATFDQIQRNKENPGSEVQVLYIGIAIGRNREGEVLLGLAIHDGTYCIDFMVEALPGPGPQSASGVASPLTADQINTNLAHHITSKIRNYRDNNLAKFMGAGMTKQMAGLCPQLAARLWSDLDIVAFVFKQGGPEESISMQQTGYASVDEESAWLARKTVKQFGPTKQPHLMLGYCNVVNVDCESRRGRAHITNLGNYPSTVGGATWSATMFYAESLKKNQTKIAFFNSTPQGGGVALMRHALIRFLHLAGVSCKWYAPNPRAGVFRITKNNHNILQGVEADPTKRLTASDKEKLDKWARDEAEPRWTNFGGPLAAREKGGADIIIVDDPQMPSLVKIAKERDPTRPVIFRSHIQVRADLADHEGTPTAGVWNWVWDNVKECDVFVSHPLDGLNKHMDHWDEQFYMHVFGSHCFSRIQRSLDYPKRKYIVQIARFDPAKGIPDVLEAYAELRNVHMKGYDLNDIPQLVIAGHGAIDDPDATIIYDETIELLDTRYRDFKDDIIVMRLGPSDQILNALMACAHVALQLSTREGFEVKVSETLHMGTPIIATRRGGIPLQVQHGKSGFLVESGDYKAVAKYLHHLFTDEENYSIMSEFAATHVSDEVSTLGNALAWLYLADTLAQGEKIEPNNRWINDMAREKAGFPYTDDEPRLPRDLQDLNVLQ